VRKVALAALVLALAPLPLAAQHGWRAGVFYPQFDVARTTAGDAGVPPELARHRETLDEEPGFEVGYLFRRARNFGFEATAGITRPDRNLLAGDYNTLADPPTVVPLSLLATWEGGDPSGVRVRLGAGPSYVMFLGEGEGEHTFFTPEGPVTVRAGRIGNDMTAAVRGGLRVPLTPRFHFAVDATWFPWHSSDDVTMLSSFAVAFEGRF
jgi:outer membrane protein W